MCIHKYHIFLNCGHSFFAPGPLLICDKATFLPLPPSQHYRLSRKSSMKTHEPFSSTCVPQAHPFRTVRIDHGLCLECEVRRKYLLAQAEQDFISPVKIDEKKWRVQYVSPIAWKGKKREDEWQKWGEEDLSVETQMRLRQRQREKSGRVGFSGDTENRDLHGIVNDTKASPRASRRKIFRN
jgi:hypothetical protein